MPRVSDQGTAETTTSPRAARTAARLREAGLAAFAELGWQGTRVEDVVQRAGVSHGTFYTYYENKSALLADLVRVSQVEFAALASAPWASDDVRGALENILSGFLDRYRSDAAIMKAWLQAAREDRSFSELYLDSRALFVDRVGENVAAVLAASGREHTPPAHTVASTLVAMVEHFAYCWLVLGEQHEPDDVLESIVLIWGSTLNALAGFELVEHG
jgi:AcrR family transcriptional regulator